MPLNAELIIAWTLLLFVVGLFTGYWSWLFYRRLTEGNDPMAAAFMLREIAFTNMFFCFTVIRSLALFGLSRLDVAYVVWGTSSTLLVVVSYLLLHRELNQQRQKERKK